MPSSYPISVEQRDVIWKFRYYLRSNKKALTKFVRSVNWNETKEVMQALQLIRSAHSVQLLTKDHLKINRKNSNSI